MTPARRCAAALALLLAAASSALLAQSGDDPDQSMQPQGAPQPDKTVRDPDFGVVARHLGLERVVEMYQWQAAEQGYSRGWNKQAQDSSGFARGHDNPPFPMQGRRWVASSVSIDGKPLDPAVVEQLGQWRNFRPSFNALPGNLAATFQPQGDGLGSAENPLEPRIGDLRIHWRELVLPPLHDRLALRDGRWQLRAQPPATTSDTTLTDASEAADARPMRWGWWLGGALLVGLIALLLAARRWRGG